MIPYNLKDPIHKKTLFGNLFKFVFYKMTSHVECRYYFTKKLEQLPIKIRLKANQKEK